MNLPDQLRSLAVPASEALVDRVLRAVGIADRYVGVDTPIGRVWVAFNDHGLSYLRLGDHDAFRAGFQLRFGRPLRDQPEPAALDIGRRLAEVLAPDQRLGRPGATTSHDLAVDLRGLSPFQADVLAAARQIPRGEVRTYGEVARSIGRPRAVRAVGTALGNNPVPLLIPCHRVVRSDGTPGDYLFGTPVKAALLAAERAA